VPTVERLLTERNVPANAEASLYELDFAAVAGSAFGGACDDQCRDYRAEFSQMWRNVTFLQQGTAFDYDGSPDKKKFLPWTKVSPPFQYIDGRSAGNTLFFALETTRINFFCAELTGGRASSAAYRFCRHR
jgi:hypothetical protein